MAKQRKPGKVKPMKNVYSGAESKPFWDRIHRIQNKGSVLI